MSYAPSGVDKFADFDESDLTYKTVGDAKLEATILIPKNVPINSPRPVMIYYHGGFWITGTRKNKDWFAIWAADFARKHGAIVVAFDYRLLPEAKGVDILSDLASSIHWLPSLSEYLKPRNIIPDFTQTLLYGESAGGWCSTQIALLHRSGLAGFPTASSPVHISAAISAFGVLDLKIPFVEQDYDKVILGMPQVPMSVLDNHMADVRSGKLPAIVTGAMPPQRMQLALGAAQRGKMLEYMGPQTELYPLENIDRLAAAGHVPPPIWFFHGTEDSAVPCQCSVVCEEKIKAKFAGAQVKLSLEPGDHGFDETATLETPWTKDGLQWIEAFWPKAQ